jgi:hypothetical protein
MAKKDAALEALFDEVDPRRKKKLKAVPAAQVTTKHPATTPVPAAARPFNQAARNAFVQLCFKKIQSDQLLREVQEDIEKLKGKIQTITQQKGRKIKENDVVLFTEGKIKLPNGKSKIAGGKALLKFKQTGDIDGGMVMEWATKNMPELIMVEKSKTLNVSALEDAMERKQLPVYVVDALKQILEFAKPSPLFFKETREENLDLAKYEEAKTAKKVPAELIESAEKKSGHYALSIWVLDQAPRCPGCGAPKPKRQKQGVKFGCKACGFEE